MSYAFATDSATNALVTSQLTADAETLARNRIARLAPILQARLVDAALSRGMATDSIDPNRGYFLARQLEEINGQAREVKLAGLTALDLFPIDGSISAGAQYYTQRRKRGSSKMVFHSNSPGSGVPVASVQQWEESYPIHTAVTGMRYDIFELLHADFAGLGLRQDLQRAMTRGVDEFLNSNGWFGDAANNSRGVLNNIFCSRAYSAVAWASATGEVILADMQAQYDEFSERDKGANLRPNRCALPPVLLNIAKRKLSAYHPQTIMEAFKQANPEVSADFFREAHELANAGPGGQHVMFWYNTSRESVVHVLPKTLTLLPAQADGFNLTVPGYIRYGGIRMDEPLHNLINYVPAA